MTDNLHDWEFLEDDGTALREMARAGQGEEARVGFRVLSGR